MDLKPEDSQRLHELSEALRSEFNVNEKDEQHQRKQPIKDLEELRADFLECLRKIVKHSDSDGLKAKVSMWGYERLLDVDKVSSDPLTELLANAPKSTTAK